MGFFSGFLSALGQIGPIVALDALSALLNGPAPQKQKDLLNKTYSSDAYGRTWPRARGTVRLRGSVIAMSNIRTTIRKTSSGGFFGIGQHSVYYNTYSASIFVAFGKKLGGGPAVQFLRLIADGKDLFNAHVSNGTITGTVSVTVVSGGQLTGSQHILVDLASGATLHLNAGDLISIPGDPGFPYEVQVPVSVTGPTTSVSVSIWPPLRVDLAGGGALSVFGLNASPYDLSSFDPDPHDGSHIDSGYVPAPGGIRFYLGSDTQAVEPDLIKMFGPGNSPAYRGLVGCWIHDLELANYGNHIPQWSAEIAFDTAAGLYPNVGPITGADLVLSSLMPEFIALPFSGNGYLQIANPLVTRQQIPYVWVFSQTGSGGGNDGTIYRVNAQKNTLEASVLVPNIGIFGLTPCGMVADEDGYLYFIQNNSKITKMDGSSLSVTATWNPSGGVGFAVDSFYCFDTVQSCFGNPVLLKLAYVGGYFFDRTVLMPLGSANPLSSYDVVLQYDKHGVPVTGPGDAALFGSGYNVPTQGVTDDSQGNIWVLSNTTLIKIDCQFISWIDISNPSNPTPMLALPTFAVHTVNVTSLVGGAAQGAIQYYPGDDTIVVIGLHKLGKVSAATRAIVQTVTGLSNAAQKISSTYDPMGTILVVDSSSGIDRVDLSSLSIVNNYSLANFVPPGTGIPLGGYAVSDPYSGSVWYDADNNGMSVGGFNRAFLDRANGFGTGLDLIVASIMSEAGFLSSQYDVTQLTASGITVYGVEFDRETYAESLRRLMQIYLFDAAPIDGKIVFITRGQSSAVTIPEADLGALGDPSKYEPRVIETLTDPLDTPESVHVHYYDPLKQDQQAVQYAKRISKPYASTLSSGKNVTNSRQQLDITVPITEDATLVKQQAEKILWDHWTGRTVRKFKLGPKYMRLTPGDVVTLAYKSGSLVSRIEQIDSGAGGALDVTARSQDASVYSSTHLLGSSAGPGSSTPPTQPPQSNNNYTLSPAQPLSQTSTTSLAMADVTALFSSGLRTFYNARSIPIPDPGVGLTALYYVTVQDPSFTGEIPGTASLTVIADLDPSVAHVGQSGYINLGTYLAAGSGATGGAVLDGGQPSASGTVNFMDEVPSGTINGTNLVFTLSQLPLSGSLELESDGTSLAPTVGYVQVGKTLTLVYAPAQTLIARYRY